MDWWDWCGRTWLVWPKSWPQPSRTPLGKIREETESGLLVQHQCLTTQMHKKKGPNTRVILNLWTPCMTADKRRLLAIWFILEWLRSTHLGGINKKYAHIIFNSTTNTGSIWRQWSSEVQYSGLLFSKHNSVPHVFKHQHLLPVLNVGASGLTPQLHNRGRSCLKQTKTDAYTPPQRPQTIISLSLCDFLASRSLSTATYGVHPDVF